MTSETSKLREKIKHKVSSMSIEELQALKSKLGSKAYEANFGDASKKSGGNSRRMKRDNKNRPREVSSKKTVSRKRKIMDEALPEPKRDPRFDPACGEFDDKVFRDSYGFVDRIKEKEQKHLKHRLESETDPEEVKKIKYLIQRHENQCREKRRLEKKKASGSSTESAYAEILDRYDSLKKQGSLDKYMQKREKKLTHNARKRLES